MKKNKKIIVLIALFCILIFKIQYLIYAIETPNNEILDNTVNDNTVSKSSEIIENKEEKNEDTEKIENNVTNVAIEENVTQTHNNSEEMPKKEEYINLKKQTNMTHKNGIYKLAIGKNSNKTVEVLRGDKYNNATVDIYTYVGNLQQKFYLEYQDEGFYKIMAMHTGKSLTVKDGKIEKETEIVQSDYQELDSQKWILRDSHINGWVISSFINPNLSISVQGIIQNGSKLILSKTEDNDNQMLYIYNISEEEQKHQDGEYKIAVGKSPRKVLEVENKSEKNKGHRTVIFCSPNGRMKEKFDKFSERNFKMFL